MLYPMELKLMELVWEHAPVTASHLCRLSAEAIGWKRTTCYTVISRLCERGCLERRGSLILPLLTREKAREDALQSVLASYFGADRKLLEETLERIAPQTLPTTQETLDI